MKTTKHAARDAAAEVGTLGRMTPAQLRARYQYLFGQPSRSGNRQYLVKRLTWRDQSLAEGGLSERAKRRAEELARDANLRTTVPRPPKRGDGPGGRAPRGDRPRTPVLGVAARRAGRDPRDRRPPGPRPARVAAAQNPIFFGRIRPRWT